MSFDTKAAPATDESKTVLIVDDSRLQRRILSASLVRWGYMVEEAENGAQALEICAERMPDFVVSDWVMPEMDGLELCRAFRELQAETYGYFILLTSKSERSEITKAYEAGADDFLTKPIDSGELRARLNAGERIIEMQRQMVRKNALISETLSELQQAYAVIDQDLIRARNVQQALVPVRSASFGPAEVALLLEPSGHVGGDLVGMFSLREERLAFYCIDVSGHGVSSALMTTRMGGYLNDKYSDQNIVIHTGPDGREAFLPPQEVVYSLNHRLSSDDAAQEYLTMAYGDLDLNSGRLMLIQAGHPPPLILRRRGDFEFIGEGGMPVGLVAGADYEQLETILHPGDRVLFYSDGFTEACAPSGAMLEEQGLVDLVKKIPTDMDGPQFVDALYEKLIAYVGSRDALRDDVSASLVTYAPEISIIATV